jgi:hypothetical protein
VASRSLALLLIAGLFGSGPALALEAPRDTSEAVSTSKAAVAASTVAAKPLVVRGLDVQRPLFVLAVAAPSLQTWERPPATPVVPFVHAACPDVVTCPSQGPPRAG